MPNGYDVVHRYLLEQIELLREHVEQGHPSPEFIERHALTIIEMSKDLPLMDIPSYSMPFFKLLEERPL
jgi:hypothetical protein